VGLYSYSSVHSLVVTGLCKSRRIYKHKTETQICGVVVTLKDFSLKRLLSPAPKEKEEHQAQLLQCMRE